MSFISYAQNYEDVILWRALKHVDKGFYIDIGAMDPTIDSVTKVFYDAGWRGINIEPVQKWFTKLVEERPEDINLQIAMGDKEGIIDFYEVVDTGLSTINVDWVVPLAEEKGYLIEHNLVNMKTLNSICEEYQVPEIQFLKIDVEGAEYLVLKGLDLKKFRPWIILIEATLPNSQIENYSEWEPLLNNNGYRFVYFDGLNRFYVAEEQSSLADRLAIPPNFFDGFITKENFFTIQELANANSNLALVQSDRDRIQTELNAAHSDKDRIRAELNAVQSERDRTQTELNAVHTDKDRAQAELNAVQTVRDRIQAELNAVQSDRVRIQTELNAVKSDRNRIQAELNAVQSDRVRIQAELNTVQSDRVRIQAELNVIKSDRDRMQAELNSVQSDRNRIRTELNTVQSDRDRIHAELFDVYNSRSFRLTKPLREVAWFFRGLPGNFQKTIYSTQLLAFSIIHYLRMLPLLSSLANSVKKSNPLLWSSIRNKMLSNQTTIYEERPTPTPSPNELPDDYNTLSLRGKQIYDDLFKAIYKKNGE